MAKTLNTDIKIIAKQSLKNKIVLIGFTHRKFISVDEIFKVYKMIFLKFFIWAKNIFYLSNVLNDSNLKNKKYFSKKRRFKK